MAHMGHESRQALTLPFVQVEGHRDAVSGEHRQWFISRACAAPDRPAERLLIVLDGNVSAPCAAQMALLRLDRAAVEPVTSCWVVGVGYPGVDFYDLARRSADYLPDWPEGTSATKGEGGRAAAFARYLDEQLLPELEVRNGRPFSEVVLYGHSYGGLFTLYKLLFCPGRTDAFFAISPSLWWANGWVLGHLPLASQTAIGKTVFLGIGREERAWDTDSPERRALHAERDLQARFSQLSVCLGGLIGPVARLRTEIFPNEDHGSVVYPSLTRAVRWAMRKQPHDSLRGAL